MKLLTHPVAEDVGRKIDYDFGKFKVSEKDAFGLAARGKVFDDSASGHGRPTPSSGGPRPGVDAAAAGDAGRVPDGGSGRDVHDHDVRPVGRGAHCGEPQFYPEVDRSIYPEVFRSRYS